MLSTVRTYSANARLSKSTAPDALYQWGLTLPIPVFQYTNISPMTSAKLGHQISPYWYFLQTLKFSNDARSHLSAPKFSKTLHQVCKTTKKIHPDQLWFHRPPPDSTGLFNCQLTDPDFQSKKTVPFRLGFKPPLASTPKPAWMH